MPDIGEDLRAFLLSTSAIAAAVETRCHQSKVPEGYKGPYLWYARAGISREDTTDMQPEPGEPFRQRWDVEAVSRDIDDAQSLGLLIHGLHARRGAFGAGAVQGVFVEDHTDDYVPRGVGGDDDLHVAAFQVEIVGYAQGE